ncbi:helix-turn-helix transcriptional regulator [Novispirillum sp. DQ9]|uniref:helix-turn-helix transcriptional regulator n=1 Tax=Novispirillum sp. DQ9 TaxID=3398612 RepID=UPI003C7E9BB7
MTRLHRLSKVREITGLATSTIYDRMKNRTFPAPVKIGARAVAWREEDLKAWLESLEMAR